MTIEPFMAGWLAGSVACVIARYAPLWISLPTVIALYFLARYAVEH